MTVRHQNQFCVSFLGQFTWSDNTKPNSCCDPWLIPKLSNILDANASDVMLKQKHKITLWKTRNYYNNNNCLLNNLKQSTDFIYNKDMSPIMTVFTRDVYHYQNLIRYVLLHSYDTQLISSILISSKHQTENF